MEYKPKILLVINILDWAYDNRAKCLIKNLSWKYDFEKVTIDECKKKKEEYFKKFDCIFFFYWQMYSKLTVKLPKNKLITGIFSWVSWENHEDLLWKNIKKHKAVIVNSPSLYSYFKNKFENIFYAPNGVDTGAFSPKKKKTRTKNFTIGWAGHAGRTDSQGNQIKGYYDLLLPTLKKIKGVRLKSVLAEKNQLPLEKMPQFYNSIDAYVCVSKSEATPNPCLEAASCGKPIITTRVGIMPWLIKNGHNGILIKRNEKALAEAITYLRDNPQKALELGKNATINIREKWGWNKLAGNYEKAFDFILSG